MTASGSVCISKPKTLPTKNMSSSEEERKMGGDVAYGEITGDMDGSMCIYI